MVEDGAEPNPGAARRSRAVPRVHLDVVVEREQHAVQRVVERSGERAHRLGAEEIGAADRADEERVSREHAARCARLVNQHGDMLGRVAGGVLKRQLDIPERELLAMARFVVRAAQASRRPGIVRTPSSASSLAPDTKSAWTCVSIAWTRVRP